VNNVSENSENVRVWFKKFQYLWWITFDWCNCDFV